MKKLIIFTAVILLVFSFCISCKKDDTTPVTPYVEPTPVQRIVHYNTVTKEAYYKSGSNNSDTIIGFDGPYQIRYLHRYHETAGGPLLTTFGYLFVQKDSSDIDMENITYDVLKIYLHDIQGYHMVFKAESYNQLTVNPSILSPTDTTYTITNTSTGRKMTLSAKELEDQNSFMLRWDNSTKK